VHIGKAEKKQKVLPIASLAGIKNYLYARQNKAEKRALKMSTYIMYVLKNYPLVYSLDSYIKYKLFSCFENF